METFKLNNGVEIPKIGFGTMLQTGDLCVNNVAYALNNGYTLIDTANRYGNEVEVGEGLKKSGLPRESYLIETKLGPTLYANEGAVDGTLERLGVDYIDIMILHHPTKGYLNAYKMLEKGVKEGKIKTIGLSNFSVEQIQEILNVCEVRPSIMQVEAHPYYPAEHVFDFCKQEGIQLQAWYPLGHGNSGMLEENVIVRLAEKYGKSPAQIVLRWHTQYGFCPVPGSKTPSHIKDNADIFDFTLTEEDMAEIATINRHDPFFHQTPEGLHRLETTKCNFEE